MENADAACRYAIAPKPLEREKDRPGRKRMSERQKERTKATVISTEPGNSAEKRHIVVLAYLPMSLFPGFIRGLQKMTLKIGTLSILMDSFSTSTTPLIVHQNLRINSSEHSCHWPNNSTSASAKSSSLVVSCFTMIFGTISNLTALGILAKSRVRFRRRSKAPFLLLTVALLLADLAGHVILGAFALYLHIAKMNKIEAGEPTTEFCKIFGASMVFFGLCSLLLGCAMAVERCVAITQPFFHSAMITLRHMWRVVLLLSSLALVLAVLPLFAVGTYTTQSPGTWCFLRICDPQSKADTNVALAFSVVGLSALTFALLCNIVSALALLHARLKSHNVDAKSSVRSLRRSSSTSSSAVCSLDVEMLAQLAGITVVSCVCWSPFLVHILAMQISQKTWTHKKDGFILLGLRMAIWNQILDPWVYILLRKTVVFRLCCAFYRQRPTMKENSFFADTHGEAFILQ
ncbi:prostaglandin E receptor 1c (subtype EP1) [Pungitius pungitius]|uniref:prostaglandin E receptor 1c (subtype EP1) n=1 Tax=Pungitius pungitius TaxID=134920 RepID=UPI002E0E236E